MISVRLTMKHLIFLLLLSSLLPLPLMAQVDEIQSIVEHDPFDPDRGKKEEDTEETDIAEPDEAPSIELPVLDGTIIYGDTRIAVLSFQQDGLNLTARVEMLPDKQGYQLFLREKKKAPKKIGRAGRSPSRRDIPNLRKNNRSPAAKLLKGKLEEEEAEDEGPKFPLDGERNGKIAGYKVLDIAQDYIMLEGTDAPFKLEMYRDGTKDGRGGSKQAVSRPQTPLIKKPDPQKGLTKVEPGNKTPVNPATANKNDKNNKKPTFNRRKPPESKRAGSLKKRF